MKQLYNKFNIIIGISCLLFFVWIIFALKHSNTPVDRDTLDYLIRYGRGDLNNGVKIFWRVHIGFGLYFKAFSYLTNDLMTPMIFLSAISLVSIALAGFLILRNHVQRKWAYIGFFTLLLIPGYHFLTLLMEDNLPFLAAIAWMACFIDFLYTKRMTLWASLLAGLALSIAFLFHIISIAFIFCPLVLLLSDNLKNNKTKTLLIFYVSFLCFLCGFLIFIPNGFQEIIKAYTGDWGFSNQLASSASNIRIKIDQMIREWPLLFLVMQATPADLNNLGSPLLKSIIYMMIVLTNFVYYGIFGMGLYQFIHKKPFQWSILGFLFIGIVIPILTASFTAERLDVFVFFAIIGTIIGIQKTENEKIKIYIEYGFYILIIFFIFWNTTLYAYYTRWNYKPEYFKKIIHVLENEKIENAYQNGLLFLDENSLFENIDYFPLMRKYPAMRHYGIEKEGRIYFIGEGWGASRNYLSDEEIHLRFYSGKYINHATPDARERFIQFHNQDAMFEIIQF